MTRVVARSVEPLLDPGLPAEQNAFVPNVVFPTAIEPSRECTGSDYDVYYGMADSRIGVARLRRTVPVSGSIVVEAVPRRSR